tara:strand:+ start:8140 stop:8319 length:180 start_codon:yes stop_codon:yes gene_type:complete
MEYYTDADEALGAAKSFLLKQARPHVLIGRSLKGYMIIDPRNAKSHYCQIVGKLYRKLR